MATDFRVGEQVQLNKYETAPIFFNKPKLDIGLFVDYSRIYLFLPVFACCDHKIVPQIKKKF